MSEKSKKKLQHRKPVLHGDAGGEADQAEERTQPELRPRAPGILTPSLLLGLIARFARGFFTGALLCLLLKLALMFQQCGVPP